MVDEPSEYEAEEDGGQVDGEDEDEERDVEGNRYEPRGGEDAAAEESDAGSDEDDQSGTAKKGKAGQKKGRNTRRANK